MRASELAEAMAILRQVVTACARHASWWDPNTLWALANGLRVAAAIGRAYQRLAEAKALREAGRHAQALPLARDGVTAAEAVAWPALQVEALQLLGTLLRHTDDAAGAERAFEDSYLEAEAEGMDRLAAQSAIHLAVLLSTEGHRFAEAERWRRHARALHAHLEGAAAADSRLAASTGSLLAAAEAERSLRRPERALPLRAPALAVRRHRPGADGTRVGAATVLHAAATRVADAGRVPRHTWAGITASPHGGPMFGLLQVCGLLLVQPRKALEALKDAEVPYGIAAVVSGLLATVAGLVSAATGYGPAGPSLVVSSSTMVVVMGILGAASPFVFGAAFWVSSRLLGSERSGYGQCVSVAASFAGLLPVSLALQALAQRVDGPRGLTLVTTACLVWMIALFGWALVVALDAGSRPTLAVGGVLALLVLAFGGFSFAVEREHHALVAAARPEPPPAPAVAPAAVERAAPPATPTPPPPPAATAEPPPVRQPPRTWTTRVQSVPPGAEVRVLPGLRLVGRAPCDVELDSERESAELKLTVGSREKTVTISRDGESSIIVTMPEASVKPARPEPAPPSRPGRRRRSGD